MSKSSYFLTIDVGTVNLAYCLAEYKPGHLSNSSILKSIEIIKWGILDVSYKPLYCKQIKNKRAICNCISKFYTLKEGTNDHSNPENLIGYCKTHAKSIQQHNKVNKKDKIKIFKINENPIYKNNFNIQMERLLTALEIFYSEVISKPYDIDLNGEPKYISNLKIYIENQPVFKNPVMKTISIGIFTFFTLKKVVNNIISNVNFINASVKTKDDFINKLFELIEVKSYINKFKDYDKRKEFTIDITNQICPKLNNSINNIVSINNYDLNKKKDDMADTIVYVIYSIIYLI
jgi:DNA-binding Xre family transcriptional regulator